MIAAIFQLLLVLPAGVLLFLLWRRYVAPAKFGFIVTAGFLVRAFAGQVLFWISWLELPFLHRLQTGNGLWFFALDAGLYVPLAFRAADQGLLAVALHTRYVASVTFVQVLGFFAYLFGQVVSVGLLVNLFAFLGSSIIVIRWSAAADTEGSRMITAARVVALAALSLSPSAILWSLQPLKDIVFQFLIVAFLGAAVAWQRAWRQSRVGGVAIGAAAVMLVTLYGIAGLRWYVATILLGASFVFAFMVAFAARSRRWFAVGAAFLLFVALTQSLRHGAGPYMPEKLGGVLRASTFTREVMAAPHTMQTYVERARSGFERTGGATAIRVGRRGGTPPPAEVARQDRGAPPPAALTAPALSSGASSPPNPPAAKPTRSSARTAVSAGREQTEVPPTDKTPQSTEIAALTTSNGQHAATHPPAAEPVKAEPVKTEPVKTEPVKTEPVKTEPVKTEPLKSEPLKTEPAKVAASKPPPAPAPAPVAAASETKPPAPAPAQSTVTPPAQTPAVAASETSGSSVPATTSAVQTPAPATPTSGAQTASATKKSAVRKSRPTQTTPPAKTAVTTPVKSVEQPPPAVAATPVPPTPTPTPAPAPVVERRQTAEEMHEEARRVAKDFVMPKSRGARVAAGATAMLVPQTVARELGLIEVGGGRGLMWFTDLDTLFFDAVLLAVVVIVIRRLRRAALSNGVFWLLTIATIMLALPLVYTVTNFGTLFRLRAMVYTGLALIPLTLLCSLHEKHEEPEHTAAS